MEIVVGNVYNWSLHPKGYQEKKRQHLIKSLIARINMHDHWNQICSFTFQPSYGTAIPYSEVIIIMDLFVGGYIIQHPISQEVKNIR